MTRALYTTWILTGFLLVAGMRKFGFFFGYHVVGGVCLSDHIYSAAWLLGVLTGPTFHLSSLAVSTFTAPPRLPRGGILGNEMGMGKTMVMLAVGSML